MPTSIAGGGGLISPTRLTENMNFIQIPQGITLEDSDALLMDVARRIQITPTQHEAAERNYKALCAWVDRVGSPLHALVGDCYPSGSFAIGAVILSRVKKAQHDVDVVLELHVSPYHRPSTLLAMLFEAINGEPGSRYHGKVTLNSRCVTVHYADGTTVDLMPIARLPGEPDRAGHLFHHKGETGEHYHKAVNPAAFAARFNERTKYDPAFSDLFRGRRLLVEGDLAKADVAPMPEQVPITEKSARTVALQLIKRDRDLAYRRREGRKPPAVALATIALEAPDVQPRLIDEVIAIAARIRERLTRHDGPRRTFQVFNPAYLVDEFTDRWPENPTAQATYDADLRSLVVDLRKLRNDNLSLLEQSVLLEKHFGETASTYAVESQLQERAKEMNRNRLRIAPTGRVLGGGAAATAGTTAARAATRSGGELPE